MKFWICLLLAIAAANSCDRECLEDCDPATGGCFRSCNCNMVAWHDTHMGIPYTIFDITDDIEWNFFAGKCDLECAQECNAFERNYLTTNCLEYCDCDELYSRGMTSEDSEQSVEEKGYFSSDKEFDEYIDEYFSEKRSEIEENQEQDIEEDIEIQHHPDPSEAYAVMSYEEQQPSSSEPWDYERKEPNKNYTYDEFEDFKNRFEQKEQPEEPRYSGGAFGSIPEDNPSAEDPFEDQLYNSDKTGSNLADQMFWDQWETNQLNEHKSFYNIDESQPIEPNRDSQWYQANYPEPNQEEAGIVQEDPEVDHDYQEFQRWQEEKRKELEEQRYNDLKQQEEESERQFYEDFYRSQAVINNEEEPENPYGPNSWNLQEQEHEAAEQRYPWEDTKNFEDVESNEDYNTPQIHNMEEEQNDDEEVIVSQHGYYEAQMEDEEEDKYQNKWDYERNVDEKINTVQNSWEEEQNVQQPWQRPWNKEESLPQQEEEQEQEPWSRPWKTPEEVQWEDMPQQEEEQNDEYESWSRPWKTPEEVQWEDQPQPEEEQIDEYESWSRPWKTPEEVQEEHRQQEYEEEEQNDVQQPYQNPWNQHEEIPEVEEQNDEQQPWSRPWGQHEENLEEQEQNDEQQPWSRPWPSQEEVMEESEPQQHPWQYEEEVETEQQPSQEDANEEDRMFKNWDQEAPQANLTEQDLEEQAYNNPYTTNAWEEESAQIPTEDYNVQASVNPEPTGFLPNPDNCTVDCDTYCSGSRIETCKQTCIQNFCDIEKKEESNWHWLGYEAGFFLAACAGILIVYKKIMRKPRQERYERLEHNL